MFNSQSTKCLKIKWKKSMRRKEKKTRVNMANRKTCDLGHEIMITS
jgi:hypothetical protein